MKNLLTLIAFALCLSAGAQESLLVFDRQYYQCENKWVALPKGNDGKYILGVVYLDRQAGFTLNYKGMFTVNEKGIFELDPLDDQTNMIYRLPESYAKVALIPEAKITEMKLDPEPDWLSVYRKGENEVGELVKRGYFFNHVGGSDIAITILEEAYKKEPHAENLEFELSYAYNATEQPEKAITLLNKALENAPKNYMFYRELGYAYIHAGKTEEAEKTYTKGIGIATDATQQAEMAFNMAGAYYTQKNKAKFDQWAPIVKKYAAEDSIYLEYLLKMEKEMN